MSMSLRYEMRGDYLYVEVTGMLSIQEACRTFREGWEEIGLRGVEKVVVDCLQLEGSLSTTNNYTYGKFIAEELIKFVATKKRSMPRLAYVAAAPVLDSQRLGQVVATNRGDMRTSSSIMLAGMTRSISYQLESGKAS